MRLLASAAVIVCLAGAASAQVLYDNGGIVTHPGQGAGGADVSMADTVVTSAGANVRQSSTNDWFRLADDFSVPSPGWYVDSVRVFVYATGSSTTSPFTDGNVNIWDGRPGDAGSSIVATSTTVLGSDWTGIYRIFNGTANLSNTQRPVMYVDFDFGGMNLGSGSYWVDWQLTSGASAWNPYVMDLATGETVLGNARQMSTDGVGPVWQDTNSGGPAVELPFQISGQVVPTPGALALLGMGGLIAARRRRA